MNDDITEFDPYGEKHDEQIQRFSFWLADSKNLRLLHYLLLDKLKCPLPRRIGFDILTDIPQWLCYINQLSYENYQFSNVLEQWIKVYRTYPIKIDHRLTQTCDQPQEFKYPAINGYLCIFLTELHHHLNASSYKYRDYHDKIEAEKNYQEYGDYIHNLFQYHARLLVIRIDFGYSVSKTFEAVRQDLANLHNNARRNAIFDGLDGYITKIEYGLEKKIHIHAFFFFNGHERQSDVDLARKIGEYWRNTITKGDGSYWNCNAKKKDYRYVGIGSINYHDVVKRQNLLRALSYLCKKQVQFIKPRNQPQANTLTRGNLRNKNLNLGAKRLYTE